MWSPSENRPEIVVVDGGVREQGTYNELMKRKGVFASLASEGKRVGEW